MLYEHVLKIKFPDLSEKFWKSLTYRILCIILTFNFVSWGFLLTLDLKKAKAVFNDASIVTLANINFAESSDNFYLSKVRSEKSSEGIVLNKIGTPDKAPYLLLGGGKWQTISPTQGWESQPRGYYRGSLEGKMSAGGRLEIICLMYNSKGALIQVKPLGFIRSYSLPIIFDFEGQSNVKRFNIALSSDVKNWPAKFNLKKLVIKKVN